LHGRWRHEHDLDDAGFTGLVLDSLPMAEVFTCAICGKPVRLEESKTDDNGKPVHEECYANKIVTPPPQQH
jgi:hypothetical protein